MTQGNLQLGGGRAGHLLIQSQGVNPARAERDRIGSVSIKDWALLNQAIDNACDAFLTMEGKLTSQADVIERVTGLKVLRPNNFWALLEPWANLYR